MQDNTIQITKIQHVGIPSNNLSNSRHFYESLGFTAVMNRTFQHDGAKGEVVMMQSGTVLIEIYKLDIRERVAGAIDHIAFNVENIDAAYEQLKQRGFSIVESEPSFLAFWENGCRFFNILGPDGERLEFNQIL